MALSPPSPKPRGRLIGIGGGRRLHAVRAGPQAGAGPLVLLEAGAFGFSADWAAVQAKLSAKDVSSLAYDRAGLGFSDSGPAPRDSLAIVRDLEALLAAIGETGPLILCGHSMAGLHVRLFAARNPGRIAGLVLVDATTPEAMDSKVLSGLVGHFGRATRLAAWGAEAGLLGMLAGPLGDAIGLEGQPAVEKRWAFAHAGHNRWAAQEAAAWAASARQGREAGGLDRDWPVAVILAGARGQRGGLTAVQSTPALVSHHGVVEHVVGATHATLLGNLYADAIVRGVDHVRAAAMATRDPKA